MIAEGCHTEAEQIEELRQRVLELEDTLRAIEEGEIDGLLVHGRVYLLEGLESFYRVFVEQMGNGGAVIDRAATILFCNRSFGSLLGTACESLTGNTVDSIPVPEVRDCIAALRDADGNGAGRDCRFVNGDGGIRVLRVTATSIGDTGSLAVLLTDLTDTYDKAAALEKARNGVRERTAELADMIVEQNDARAAALNMMEDAVEAAQSLEAAYHSLEAEMAARLASEDAARRLATVVEQASDAIVITDPSGTIEYVNRSFEKVTGYSAAEAIGRNPRILNSGQHDDAFYREFWRCLNSGDVWRGHLVNRRKDGALFHEEGTIFPLRDSTGKVTHFVAIKRDVSDELALREQLVRAQRMEAIGTLAGGVAHDFNNLLQAMNTFVELLRRKKADRYIDQLAATIQRGSKLTRQLLLFARREVVVKFETVDVNEILAGLHEFLRRVVRENIALAVEPALRPLPILGDRGQIEQVIVNLTVNAIDAMPDGGSLSIVARADGDAVWLEVADSGTGIPPEVREQIFDPFFTTKAPGKGTGLGLAVVLGIVTAHEGQIAVECPTEGGTRFSIRLPRHGEACETLPVRETGTPMGHRERVLVVEDEPAAREGLCGVLELIGYVPVAAASGEEALSHESGPPFDVLLTDVTLPGISGIEAARLLCSAWPCLKVVVMSGYATREVARPPSGESIRFLQKPFEISELARALRDALAE